MIPSIGKLLNGKAYRSTDEASSGLLNQAEYDPDNNSTFWRKSTKQQLLLQQAIIFIISVALCLSFLGNVVLALSKAPSSCQQSSSAKYSYSGIPFDTPTTYHHHSDYWGDNETLATILWENINIDPMVVALSDEWALQHGLPLSRRFVWDDSKGRYFLKVFHQLHCLKFIRKAVFDYQNEGKSDLEGRHVFHCLASLRQDILCAADDTPMPTGPTPRSIGDGQVLMCRNFDKLVAWALAPERNACHKSLDEYRQITHSRERYAFCPKDSQYFNKMQRFFNQHGHQDPYE